MNCESCRTEIIPSDSLFCSVCGAKQANAIRDSYLSPFGLWEVTTEGDVEGRSTKNLGTHEGFVDEIARNLAGTECYSLHFRRVHPKAHAYKTAVAAKQVSIQFHIDSGTWDLSPEAREKKAREIFKDRHGVTVEKGNYYASFILHFNDNK